MPATWLVALSWLSLIIAFTAAVAILIDIYGARYRQRMVIMEAVWPITALYFGPVAAWAYPRFGRTRTNRWRAEHRRDDPVSTPAWHSTALAVSHCGAGCTIGDIIAEIIVFGLGLTVASSAFGAALIGDYVAALILGIGFQYFAIAPMRGLGPVRGLIQAAKADVLSLTAFEVGLFGWMAIMSFVLFPAPHQLHPDSPVFWFLMQIGMVIGFATAWPANVWLIHRGIKERM